MNPPAYERYRPFVNVFVPFALLLTAGNLAAEAGQVPIPSLLETNPSLTSRLAGNLTFARVVYSAWLALAFALPALVLFLLYDLGTAPPAVYRYWQLFWAFGFAAYAAHAYLAVGVWFEWDFAQIARRQTPVVAAANYALLVAWGVEVAVSVVRGQQASRGGAFRYLQWFTHLLFAVATFAAAVWFYSVVKTPISYGLGWVVTAAAVTAAAVRLIWR
jgi:hypothetical protein